MAQIVLDVQSPPSTPSAGVAIGYFDTRTKKFKTRDDAGVESILGDVVAQSVANQTGFSTDTYMTGSPVAIPNSLVRVGTAYRFKFDMVKTAAGTATPIFVVRFGTAGTTADTARLTFTFGAGTAAIDTGLIDITAYFRVAGASATMVGIARISHHLAATGLTSTGASGNGIILATAAAFDATVANSIIGVSFNGGASFAGTNTFQQATLRNV